MTAKQILKDLKFLGTEATKKTLLRHGAKEPVFGVKVADLKVFQKKIKKGLPAGAGSLRLREL